MRCKEIPKGDGNVSKKEGSKMPECREAISNGTSQNIYKGERKACQKRTTQPMKPMLNSCKDKKEAINKKAATSHEPQDESSHEEPEEGVLK
jgi:hypothetical protein